MNFSIEISPDIQLILDELRKFSAMQSELFADLAVCISRVAAPSAVAISRVATHSTAAVSPVPEPLIIADNWGGLFNGGDDPDEQRPEAPIVADSWGGIFEQPTHILDERESIEQIRVESCLASTDSDVIFAELASTDQICVEGAYTFPNLDAPACLTPASIVSAAAASVPVDISRAKCEQSIEKQQNAQRETERSGFLAARAKQERHVAIVRTKVFGASDRGVNLEYRGFLLCHSVHEDQFVVANTTAAGDSELRIVAFSNSFTTPPNLVRCARLTCCNREHRANLRFRLIINRYALHAVLLGGYDSSLDDDPATGFVHFDAPLDRPIGHVGQAFAAVAALRADAVGAAGGGLAHVTRIAIYVHGEVSSLLLLWVHGNVYLRSGFVLDDPAATVQQDRTTLQAAQHAVELLSNSIERAHFHAMLLFVSKEHACQDARQMFEVLSLPADMFCNFSIALELLSHLSLEVNQYQPWPPPQSKGLWCQLSLLCVLSCSVLNCSVRKCSPTSYFAVSRLQQPWLQSRLLLIWLWKPPWCTQIRHKIRRDIFSVLIMVWRNFRVYTSLDILQTNYAIFAKWFSSNQSDLQYSHMELVACITLHCLSCFYNLMIPEMQSVSCMVLTLYIFRFHTNLQVAMILGIDDEKDTVLMAVSELQLALEELKATEVEVDVVRMDDPTFRLSIEAEIIRHLKAINPGKVELKALLHGTLTSVLVLDTHLATICLLRAGLNWHTVCCIVLKPCLFASKLTILDWMLMAAIQLEIMCNGAKLQPTPWPSFSFSYHMDAAKLGMFLVKARCLLLPQLKTNVPVSVIVLTTTCSDQLKRGGRQFDPNSLYHGLCISFWSTFCDAEGQQLQICTSGSKLLLSVHMAGCVLVPEQVQRKCGGNCRYFLLDETGQKISTSRTKGKGSLAA